MFLDVSRSIGDLLHAECFRYLEDAAEQPGLWRAAASALAALCGSSSAADLLPSSRKRAVVARFGLPSFRRACALLLERRLSALPDVWSNLGAVMLSTAWHVDSDGLTDADAVAVSRLVQSSNALCAAYGCAICWLLARSSRIRTVFERLGFVGTLLRTLRVWSARGGAGDSVVEFGIAALWAMLASDTLMTASIAANGPAVLVDIASRGLASGRDPSTRRLALAVLRAHTRVAAGARAVVESGAVPTLVLVATNALLAPDTRIHCVAAMENIARLSLDDVGVTAAQRRTIVSRMVSLVVSTLQRATSALQLCALRTLVRLASTEDRKVRHGAAGAGLD